MYRSMLVPLDGSTFAEHALPYARTLARRCGARVHVVLAHTPIAAHAADIASPRLFTEWEDSHRLRERAYLERVAERLREDGVDSDVELRVGDAARELIERSEAGVDLVLLATHGRGGIERLWMGSVADALVRHVHVPVLLVRPPAEAAEPSEPREAHGAPGPHERSFRHVVAATDGTEAAELGVEHAARIARLYGARLTLLRVVAMPAGLGSPYLPHTAEADRETVERREDEARQYLRWLASQLDTGDTVATLVVRAYHEARGILTGAREVDADLIVVGTHRRLRIARTFLGSVTDRVVRGADVPVLVVHRGDAPVTEPLDPVVA